MHGMMRSNARSKNDYMIVKFFSDQEEGNDNRNSGARHYRQTQRRAMNTFAVVWVIVAVGSMLFLLFDPLGWLDMYDNNGNYIVNSLRGREAPNEEDRSQGRLRDSPFSEGL